MLLLTYGLGARKGEELLVWVVLFYGLGLMAVGLVRAFNSTAEHHRPSLFRLGVLLGLVVLIAGSLAVTGFHRQARQDAALKNVTDSLEQMGKFNTLEATFTARLELTRDDLEAGLATLGDFAPRLTAYDPAFRSMEAAALRLPDNASVSTVPSRSEGTACPR